MEKSFNFSVTTKTLLNKDITAIIEDAVKDFEKEEADKIRAKKGFTIPNSKPQKDTLSKNERKALKELKHKTSIVNLPADKGRSIVILNREDYLEKWMDDITQWSVSKNTCKDPTNKIKAKTLKQILAPMEN